MKLRELRESRGLSACEVGRKLNVTPNAVWNWETGRTGIWPKYHKKLAKLYGVTVDELVAAVEESAAIANGRK